MSHPDPEDLALGALEGITDDDLRGHLEQCPPCRDELESLRRVVAAGRAGGRPDATIPARPSEQVWDRIAMELQLPADREAGDEVPDDAPESGPDDGPEGGRVASDRRWWQRPTAWVAAAAVLVGALGTVIIQRVADSPEGIVLASADLQPLPGWDGDGTAEVEQTDGSRVLVVDLTTEPDQGYREVWLISADLERLVSLGVLTGSQGRFDLPDDLDLEDFAIVDVSAEPLDGDPAHSGDSIVRGELS